MKNLLKGLWTTALAVFVFQACNNPETAPSNNSDTDVFETDTLPPIVAPTDQLTKELDSLESLIRNEPENIDHYLYRAQLYLDNYVVKYASSDVARALAIDTNNTKALLLWGDVHFAMNQTRKSRDAWQRCIKIDRNNVDCRLKLAELYAIVMDFKESMRLTNEVIEIDPNNATAMLLKGLNFRELRGDTATALQYIQRSIELDPKNENAIDMAAVMHLAQNSELAEAYFKRLLEVNPNRSDYHYKLGMYYINFENWKKAEEALKKATQVNPGNFEAYMTLGYTKMQQDRLEEAVDDFTKCLAIRPVNHRALYSRGIAYELMGDDERAIKDFQEAMRYNPSHVTSGDALKRVLEKGQELN